MNIFGNNLGKGVFFNSFILNNNIIFEGNNCNIKLFKFYYLHIQILSNRINKKFLQSLINIYIILIF